MDGGEPKSVVKQTVTYTVVNVILDPEVDETNKRPQEESVIVKKVDYSFTAAASHLLSLVSGINEADISAIKIVNSDGTFFPAYSASKEAGAITIIQDGNRPGISNYQHNNFLKGPTYLNIKKFF